MPQIDVTLLTDRRYHEPVNPDWYAQQILDDDALLREALEEKGLRVARTFWDDPTFDWSQTRCAVFRTTWDYFDRFPEFSRWLETTRQKTRLINAPELIYWNIDKHYLRDLAEQGIRIPPTCFIEPGDPRPLKEIVDTCSWPEMILKPAISGAARHTYRIHTKNVNDHERIFRSLIAEESMLLQEFQHRILEEGEISLMVIGGQYSHAVLKKAKPGDFRVQDDFGGSVQDVQPSPEEIHFAEQSVSFCHPIPVYARVDIIRDNAGQICLSELELIEPELWLRHHPAAAIQLAGALSQALEPV
ncbi:MAG: hypothetical protein K9I85_06520 [Saprospiraceae bacterium]|nr:hypothetical protein [Saprospiraceae bacterium]